jgi:hypothetical protein
VGVPIFRTTIDDVQFREAIGMTAGGMNMQRTEIFPVVDDTLRAEFGEILVTECDDSPFCDKKSEFVLAVVGETGQLYTFHDRPEFRTEMVDFGPCVQEIWLGFVSVGAGLKDILEGNVRFIVQRAIPHGEISRIRCHIRWQSIGVADFQRSKSENSQVTYLMPSLTASTPFWVLKSKGA